MIEKSKNMEKYKTKLMEKLRGKYKEFGKNQRMVDFLNYLEKTASPSELQDLINDVETSGERGVLVKIQNKKGTIYHLPLGEPRDDIILVKIENEIKRINKRITSIESNIIKMEGKSISKKYESLGAGIDHLSDLSTDIYKTLLKAPSISTKEGQSVGLPIPYIISLSLSMAVTIFCGTSLYVNIFNSIRLFDPYTSLFWFFGSIGIGLMSLKGIFSWRNK